MHLQVHYSVLLHKLYGHGSFIQDISVPRGKNRASRLAYTSCSQRRNTSLWFNSDNVYNSASITHSPCPQPNECSTFAEAKPPTPCVYMKAGIYPRTRVNLHPVRHSRGYYLAWVVIYISYQLHNARLPSVPGLQPRSVLPTLLHTTVSFRPSLLSRVDKGRSSLRLASLSQPHMSGEVSLRDKFIVSATPTSPGTVPPRSFQHAIQTLQVF
ncbi:hypothetical protein GGR55DRAFT_482488 [Xylaria sp. FL0064]|nr:hypothetical protein GGR55DRAFT_482488 [Xylaria sp. FL0064]